MRAPASVFTLVALCCAAAPLAGCGDEPAADEAPPISGVELHEAGGRVLVGADPAAVYFSDLTPDRVEVRMTAQDGTGWWTFTGYVPVEAWGAGEATLTLTDHPAQAGQANSGTYADPTTSSSFASGGTVTIRRDGFRLSGELSPAADFLAGHFEAASDVACFLREHPQDASAVQQADLSPEGCAPLR